MEKPFTLKFPIGGLDKSKGYSTQPPFTTVDCVNVWPSDWTEGRERGGTRPRLMRFSVGGFSTPLNWTELVYVKSAGSDGYTTYRGVAVTHKGGVKTHTYGGSWKEVLPQNNNGFASCAVFLQKLYYARSGHPVLVYDLAAGGSEELKTTEILDENGASYDPKQYKGQVREGCGIVCSHGGALWLAGDEKGASILYRCRIGDAQDWDYSAVDQGAAWASSGSTEGKISEPVTSLFTHMSNQCLLVGCTDSCYVVTGNPRIGNGHIRSISNSVGPLMQSAICKIGDDRTFFFSRDGLYVMRPGCGEPPTPVSRKQLPSDLVGLNPGKGDRVAIGYDALHKGIHIYANGETYWFYDLQSGGFWPMEFEPTLELPVTYPSQISQHKSGLIAIGSRPYRFETLQSGDSAASIDSDSYLWYGPFALGSPHTEGILTEITAVLSSISGEVEWGIYTGETAEHAKADPKPFTGTWKTRTTGHVRTGLNYKANPIKRGTMGYLKVASVDKSSWSIEEIMAVRRMAGRRTVG